MAKPADSKLWEVKRGFIGGGHRGVTFILSIFEVHLEVIGTKVGGAIVVARSILDVHE